MLFDLRDQGRMDRKGSPTAAKVTTGKITMTASGNFVGVAQNTGVLVHGVFKKNDAAYLGETHYSAANCQATTCGAQERVVNYECVACAAGKWNANGAALFTTATANAECAQKETCTLHQFVASDGKCMNKNGGAATGTHTTLATCIAGAATNTWRVCTHCPSKCYARGQYRSVANGAEITGNQCGAKYTLTIPSTDFSGANIQEIGAVVTQATSLATGTIAVRLSSATTTSVVVTTTSNTAFSATGVLTFVTVGAKTPTVVTAAPKTASCAVKSKDRKSVV